MGWAGQAAFPNNLIETSRSGLVVNLGLFKKRNCKYFEYKKVNFIWYTLYKQRFFSAQPQCCLTFSWSEFQMLLRCCLIQTSIIMLWHFLYLLYLCPCQDLGLFMLYPCYLLFYFHPHFHYDWSYNLTSTDTLAFYSFLEYILLFLNYNGDKKCG